MSIYSESQPQKILDDPESKINFEDQKIYSNVVGYMLNNEENYYNRQHG